MLSVGLLSGGYGADELSQAGAFRVRRQDARRVHDVDERAPEHPHVERQEDDGERHPGERKVRGPAADALMAHDGADPATTARDR